MLRERDLTLLYSYFYSIKGETGHRHRCGDVTDSFQFLRSILYHHHRCILRFLCKKSFWDAERSRIHFKSISCE